MCWICFEICNTMCRLVSRHCFLTLVFKIISKILLSYLHFQKVDFKYIKFANKKYYNHIETPYIVRKLNFCLISKFFLHKFNSNKKTILTIKI